MRFDNLGVCLDLIGKLREGKLPTLEIADLYEKAQSQTGIPRKVAFTDRVVGKVVYRDGTELDSIFPPAW